MKYVISEHDDSIIVAKTIQELWLKAKFIGFESNKKRYMIIKLPRKDGFVAAKPNVRYCEPERQNIEKMNKYRTFSDEYSLYEWIMEEEEKDIDF